MTRETKVGAVVAVSFLSLVGVVVGSKWLNQNQADKELAQNVKPAESTSTGNNGGLPTNDPPTPEKKGPVENASFVAPIDLKGIGARLPGMTEESAPNVPALPLVAAPTLSPTPNLPTLPIEDPLKNLQAEIEKQKALPALPPIAETGKKIDETAAAALEKLQNAKNQGLDNLNKGVGDFFNRGADAVNNQAKQINNQLNNGVQVAQESGNKGAATANNTLDDILKKGNGALNKGVENVNKALPTLPPPPIVDVNTPLPSLPPPPSSPNSKPNPAATPTPTPTAPPPLATNPTPLPALPALPSVSSPTSGLPMPTPAPTPTPTPTPAPQANFPPLPSPPPPSTPIPAPVVGLPAPPLEARPTPPSGFTIPAPKAEARVVDFEVKSYTVRGDETMAGLSKAAYGSERYANALMAYNRDFSRNPNLTSLQPGQKLLIPPANFLEERYATALTAPGNAPPAVSINPPVPLTQRPAIPAATSDRTKTYRVPGQGQFLFDIARQTMGSGDRWTDIYRLNPNIQPAQPIPGGTELRLPPGANVQ